MKYLSVTETAKKWGMSERSVRNYCALQKIDGAFLVGKTWNIPEDAIKPRREHKKIERPDNLLDILKIEKDNRISGGIYHKMQIDLTYNSNHIEGSKLTHDQTRYIFETNTINQAYAKRGARNIEGYTWQEEKSAKILNDLANNSNAGGIAAMGAGLGMGVAAGGVFGGMANQMFSPMQGAPQGYQQPQNYAPNGANPNMGAQQNNGASNQGFVFCGVCGAKNPNNMKFCGSCGAPLKQTETCPVCGFENPTGTKFCGNCGARRN